MKFEELFSKLPLESKQSLLQALEWFVAMEKEIKR